MEANGRTAQVLNVFLAVGICLLLAFGPLAFGGVQAWAMFILEAGAALLLGGLGGPRNRTPPSGNHSQPFVCSCAAVRRTGGCAIAAKPFRVLVRDMAESAAVDGVWHFIFSQHSVPSPRRLARDGLALPLRCSDFW